MEQKRQVTHLAARISSVVVFLAGIALLVLVFVFAYQMFEAKQLSGSILAPGPDTTNPTTNVVWILGKVGFLFIMAYVASSIASKGIMLYDTIKD